MEKNKSSISNADSYKDIGEFWDTHDLDEFWEQTQPVEFETDLKTGSMYYYPLDSTLSEKLRSTAKQRGVSLATLLNVWVQEKLQEEKL